jgi:hypothetical protein
VRGHRSLGRRDAGFDGASRRRKKESRADEENGGLSGLGRLVGMAVDVSRRESKKFSIGWICDVCHLAGVCDMRFGHFIVECRVECRKR